MVRRALPIAAVVLILTACSGTGGGGTTNTSDRGGDTTNTASEGSATTLSDGTQPTTQSDVSSLLTDAELAIAFPDGVPDETCGQLNRGDSCTWGPEAANLTLTVWPGAEFYSGCDACQTLDLGDEAWVDGSPFFWTALVLVDGKTVQLLAVGLGIEEADFLGLVEAAVDRL